MVSLDCELVNERDVVLIVTRPKQVGETNAEAVSKPEIHMKRNLHGFMRAYIFTESMVL